MAYYYPEGYFGPVCDAPVSDADIAFRSRGATTDAVIDEYITVYPLGPEVNWWSEMESVMDPPPSVLKNIKCKQAEDGTFYDCIYDFTQKIEPLVVPEPSEVIGLKDKFYVPNIGPDSCSPFDPDINIRPKQIRLSDGTIVSKYTQERSTPVTFPVSATSTFREVPSDLDIAFNSGATQVIVTGTGDGVFTFDLEWDDDPSTSGTAVDTITIEGVTWTRSGETGTETNSVQLSAGTYNVTYTGLNAANNPISVSGTNLCLKDGSGSDCNARFELKSITNINGTVENSQWNSDGNDYAVWVNAEVCTLPTEVQSVSYVIPIPATDTYGFTFGCDDSGSVSLNDTDLLFNNVVGGIFNNGVNDVPYTVTRSLTQGNIAVTVSVTNGSAGYVDSEGNPEGDAYNWAKNPGGWFLKICRGGPCTDPTLTVPWVPAGPHQLWSTFMNNYAVYTSNTDPDIGSHTTSWQVTIPVGDSYDLEVQADNSATISWDGTQVATSNSYTTSTTVTLSNVSSGVHTLSATVDNVAIGGTTIDSWSNNPGGVAWTLTGQTSSNMVAKSTDLGVDNTNLVWHTRLATGYKYYEV